MARNWRRCLFDFPRTASTREQETVTARVEARRRPPLSRGENAEGATLVMDSLRRPVVAGRLDAHDDQLRRNIVLGGGSRIHDPSPTRYPISTTRTSTAGQPLPGLAPPPQKVSPAPRIYGRTSHDIRDKELSSLSNSRETSRLWSCPCVGGRVLFAGWNHRRPGRACSSRSARRAAESGTVRWMGGFHKMSSAERRGAVQYERAELLRPDRVHTHRMRVLSPAVARYYLTCKEGVGTHCCDLSARPQLILGGAVRSRVHLIHDASDWRALGVRISSRRLAFDRGWRERDEPIVSRTVRRRSPLRMHFEARDVGRIKKADGRRMPVHTFLLVHDDHPGWRPRADAQIHCTIPPPPLPESRKLHRNLAATSHSSGRCIDEGVSFSGYPVTIFPKTSHIPPRLLMPVPSARGPFTMAQLHLRRYHRPWTSLATKRVEGTDYTIFSSCDPPRGMLKPEVVLPTLYPRPPPDPCRIRLSCSSPIPSPPSQKRSLDEARARFNPESIDLEKAFMSRQSLKKNGKEFVSNISPPKGIGGLRFRTVWSGDLEDMDDCNKNVWMSAKHQTKKATAMGNVRHWMMRLAYLEDGAAEAEATVDTGIYWQETEE
ncbi:hypothetical protein B0H11DRAFT_1920479 [Mycena galericulata]|nr:hypothetical protein B0H11DRAFT_1920479 [Mycena galericulata]